MQDDRASGILGTLHYLLVKRRLCDFKLLTGIDIALSSEGCEIYSVTPRIDDTLHKITKPLSNPLLRLKERLRLLSEKSHLNPSYLLKRLILRSHRMYQRCRYTVYSTYDIHI